MSLTLKDRCKQKIAANAGTGSVTLSTSVRGFKTISSALSNGDTSYFCLESANGDWEVFSGTYTASGTTISRDTVLASSNSGNKIDIGTSITFCYIVYPADKALYKDGSNRAVMGAGGIIFSDSSVQTTAATSPDLSPYLTIAAAASTYAALAGSYLDPAWITGLAWSKISGTPTTLLGYGITDSITSSVAAATYVPYTGATGAVNLGTNALTTGAITASGLLSLQNATTPTEFNLHNTFTSTTAREYLKMLAVTGGAYQIGSAVGSAGGTNRAVQIGHFNSAGTFNVALAIDTSGNTGISNSGAGWYFDLTRAGWSGRLAYGYMTNGVSANGAAWCTLVGRSDQQALIFTQNGAFVGNGVDGSGEGSSNGFKFGLYSSGGGVTIINSNGSGVISPILRWGGATSSYPAIKQSSAAIALRLADDSADAALTCGAITASGLITSSGSANTYGITLPNTVGIAARNVGNTAWNRILNYTAANQCAVGDFDGGGGGLGLYGSGANSWTIASTGHLTASGAFNVTTSGTVDATSFRKTGTTTQALQPADGIWYIDGTGGFRYRDTGSGYATTFQVSNAGSVTCGAITASGLITASVGLESNTYVISNTGRFFSRNNSSQGYILGASDDCNMNRIGAGIIGFGTGATGSTAAEIRCGAITASGAIVATAASSTSHQLIGPVGASGGVTALRVTDNTNATFRVSFENGNRIMLSGNDGSHNLSFGGKSGDTAGNAFVERFRIDNAANTVVSYVPLTVNGAITASGTLTVNSAKHLVSPASISAAYELIVGGRYAISYYGGTGYGVQPVNIQADGGLNVMAGGITASGAVTTTHLLGSGTGYSLGVFGTSADISSAYRNLDINAPTGTIPVLQFKINSVLKAQHYWETTGAGAFEIWSAGDFILGSANSSFLMKLGGFTSSYPAIKRSGTTTAFRLADDSADGPISCGAITTSKYVEATEYLISNQGRIFARANGSAGFLLGASDDCNVNRISAGVIGFGTGSAGSTAAEIRCAAITASGIIRQSSEITSTPSGTTQTITLDSGNHQTLNLTSSTGAVTATLTVPTSSSAGTIIIKQHATTPRDITWAVSSGSFMWMGTEPTWASDAANDVRILSWRWNGSVLYLMATDIGA